MRAAGFNGLDGLAFDLTPPLQGMAYMLTSPDAGAADQAALDELHKGHGSQTTSAVELESRPSTQPPLKSTILIADSASSETAVLFQKQLRSRGHVVTVQRLGESLAPSSHVIVLVDTTLPFFHNISAINFSTFQDFLRELQRSHSGALWVTRSSQVGCKDPRYAMSIGVARTSRTEFGVDLATCELETVDHSSVALALDVFEQFRERLETETYLRELEYMIHNNSILVGRMLPFSMQEEVENPARSAFSTSDSMLVFDSDTAKWVVHALQPTLGPNKVEIDIDTAGVSYLVCVGYVALLLRLSLVDGSCLVLMTPRLRIFPTPQILLRPPVVCRGLMLPESCAVLVHASPISLLGIGSLCSPLDASARP